MTNKLPTLRERAQSALDSAVRAFGRGDGLYADKENGDYPGFAWGQGILLSAFVAGAENVDARRFEPLLRQHAHALQAHFWRADGPVAGWNASADSGASKPDRYYDDNAWIVLALLDAHKLTGDPVFLEQARAGMAYVLSGFDTRTGGGIYWHEGDTSSKNTCVAAPAAVAAIGFAAQTREAEWSQWARRLYGWLRATLRDPADGLYWDNIKTATGAVDKAKWSYNSALVLRLELELAGYWGGSVYRKRAADLADACASRWFDKEQRILRDDASFAHLLCENLLLASSVLGQPAYRDVALESLDTLWARVRRPNSAYPKHWAVGEKNDGPSELLWTASAARAYAFAASYDAIARRRVKS